MTTFKQEMQDLAYELIVEDEDFSTISVECIHRQPQYQTYDEEFGDMYQHNSDSIIIAIIGPFAQSKVNAQDILAGDLRLVVPVLGLTQKFQVSVDRIIVPDGTTYTIIDSTMDAAEAAYILQLRKDNEQS